MRKWIIALLMLLSVSSVCWASVEGIADLNAGADPPSYLDTLPNMCPRPVNCAHGANFLRLSDADECGCCDCHGNAQGCTGGAEGYIICGDGTYARACKCRFSVNIE